MAGTYNGPVGEIGLAERRAIVERAVGGEVRWGPDGSWGYCACPGGHLGKGHGHEPRACKAFAAELAGAGRGGNALPPGVYCVHQVCSAVVEETSRRIRSEIGKAKAAAGRHVHGRAHGQPSGTFRAVDNARRAEAKAGSPPAAPSRTLRTGSWGLSGKEGGAVRTQRTDEARPLTQFARTRIHAQVRQDVPVNPSEPSTAVAKLPQPVPQPTAAAEPPGLLTLCLKGEEPRRVKAVGNTYRDVFTFKDSKHDRS